MGNEYIETLTAVTSSIKRVPDQLSTSEGETIRANFARIFSDCITSVKTDCDGLYLALPFQASFLTDPVIFITGGGFVLLDHPTKAEQYEFAINAHVISLNRDVSLYQNRYPRLILVPQKHETIAGSRMVNRLAKLNFQGPFAKEV
ncbi:hypothetical protein [Flavobacterium sp.]|jgi:hypothetical protein|uniref:hypothetical protein n=1 Tax=Flavobacterium sp. TaxID=239 RepID=UPI0037C160F2